MYVGGRDHVKVGVTFPGLLTEVPYGIGQGLCLEDPQGVFTGGKPMRVISRRLGPKGQQQKSIWQRELKRFRH